MSVIQQTKKPSGISALFKENLVKGLDKEAKKGKYCADRRQVVKFQLMKNPPQATPMKKKLQKLTTPRYSGSKKRYCKPSFLPMLPLSISNRISQLPISNRLLRKWRINNCTGKENQILDNRFFTDCYSAFCWILIQQLKLGNFN